MINNDFAQNVFELEEERFEQEVNRVRVKRQDDDEEQLRLQMQLER